MITHASCQTCQSAPALTSEEQSCPLPTTAYRCIGWCKYSPARSAVSYDIFAVENLLPTYLTTLRRRDLSRRNPRHTVSNEDPTYTHATARTYIVVIVHSWCLPYERSTGWTRLAVRPLSHLRFICRRHERPRCMKQHQFDVFMCRQLCIVRRNPIDSVCDCFMYVKD